MPYSDESDHKSGRVRIKVPNPLLALHSRQLPRSGSRLLARHSILEPQDVRDQRGVAQHKELAESPGHDVGKVLRQEEMRNDEPADAEDEAGEGTAEHLFAGVVQEVGAADRDESGH